MEMFGWTVQMCHWHCPGQPCKHWTHRKPCTSSLLMTLPSPSESCPAARSSFAETGLRDPPLGKMRPAITSSEANMWCFFKRHEPWLLNTCFGRAKKVSKRRRAFLNCKKMWQQSNILSSFWCFIIHSYSSSHSMWHYDNKDDDNVHENCYSN